MKSLAKNFYFKHLLLNKIITIMQQTCHIPLTIDISNTAWENIYITALTFSMGWLALHLALEKSVIAAQKIATLECKARKCTLLKYFPSFLIFGSFSNQQNIYLPVSPHPTIALNFRIRTQRERSWNYANEYLFPLPLLQPLLRLEVSWREREKKWFGN